MENMITVGIRDLKNQLSQYLQYVKDGEKVTVMEHNRIIAEIIVPEKKNTNTSIEEKFEQLKREGKMILSKQNETLVKKPYITEEEKKIKWESIYNDVRADRF
ncbi:MAG: type II toxin-antitoxin system prevent-host-death family antitoxin [Spirochaetaceae bacterium]|jgi:antitoxin (DNA-binding transcriptional repressor) of toxin-antitoxin stability system|nr:type II toxin-antitoxin system prevent-host-death family antitoxin [Spirochaetaceae bacterium]